MDSNGGGWQPVDRGYSMAEIPNYIHRLEYPCNDLREFKYAWPD
jgi:hypothetical protein